MARATAAAVFAALGALTILPGCAVSRGQSTVGEYVDDATITAQAKARMAENKNVAATAISVETLKGEVMLTGFAKSAQEKMEAEKIVRDLNGVKRVKNDIVVRP
ncbi:MAG: BON domain-containing protein [Rubrivivax sp.]